MLFDIFPFLWIGTMIPMPMIVLKFFLWSMWVLSAYVFVDNVRYHWVSEVMRLFHQILMPWRFLVSVQLSGFLLKEGSLTGRLTVKRFFMQFIMFDVEQIASSILSTILHHLREYGPVRFWGINFRRLRLKNIHESKTHSVYYRWLFSIYFFISKTKKCLVQTL